MQNIALLASRVLMSFMFILSAGPSILDSAGRAGYMASAGLPGFLALPSALFEFGAALCLLVGFKTRYAAWALAGFCFATAVLFHFRQGDQMQMMIFMKELAMAGGFLALAEAGAGSYSVDAKSKK